jgi:hypothetical protein
LGKKPQRHSWPEAKKLCRLNQHDIEMAKRLGFGPDALIRARPDPKQKWKLPVKCWVHELYAKRFGEVLGEKPLPAPTPWVYDEEAARRFEEELYWEDYWARNEEPAPVDTRNPRAIPKPDVTPSSDWPAITDDDVPF